MNGVQGVGQLKLSDWNSNGPATRDHSSFFYNAFIIIGSVHGALGLAGPRLPFENLSQGPFQITKTCF